MSIKCYLPVLNCLTQMLYLYIVKRKDAPLFKTGNRPHHHHPTKASSKGITVPGATPLEGGIPLQQKDKLSYQHIFAMENSKTSENLL
jgi:hypothetical protein